MSLDLARLSNISRDVASCLDDRLSVLSVTAIEGGGDHLELLVTIEGCHREPCKHLFNVSRAKADQFESEVRLKLQEALIGHRID